MPTVVIEGQLKFIINTRENAFEPPHVHVWIGNEDLCRIELNGGSYMEDPPPGMSRDIRFAYKKHSEAIRNAWDIIRKR
ncbi:MAG: DUF4160 domain-containing protein [SAR202 cluster bacterium]|nr:DUF4160 domain-containing protein [SAR202 cluster bacterium]